MVLFRNKKYFIWISLVIAFGIAFFQVLNSRIGILVFLIFFGAFTVFGVVRDMAVPILLFFLPWSPLMKLQPGTMSMYSIVLVAVLLILLLKNSKRFTVSHIFPAMLLLVLTIVVKMVTDDPIDNGYILFFACLLLFPLIASEKEKEYDYFTLVLFFSLGIITAALSAQQLMIFPTISRYVVVDAYQSITRLSGYYGDPNFYSAHVSAAISGVLVLILNETKFFRKIILYLALAVLLYCGFLSVSKSFALIIVCIALLWIIEILFRRGRISGKIMMLLALFVGVLFILSSVFFTDLIDMMIERFIGSGGDLSDLTTRRTELWLIYLREFEENPLLLIFGKGFSDDLINGRASHNILIQSVYQFGIIGTVVLGEWAWVYIESMLKSIRIYLRDVVQGFILLGGALGPWLALDTLMFDEFFLLPFFVSFGITYITNKNNDDLQVVDDIGVPE